MYLHAASRKTRETRRFRGSALRLVETVVLTAAGIIRAQPAVCPSARIILTGSSSRLVKLNVSKALFYADALIRELHKYGKNNSKKIFLWRLPYVVCMYDIQTSR
jgi:hypothetical protein